MSSDNSDQKPITSQDEAPIHHDIKSVTYSGDGDEFVIIGDQKYYRHELMQAFLGTLNPGYTTYTKNPFGNASALGLACFASTTFVLGLFYAHAKGIKQPNVMVGIAVFYGGLIEFLAGCYEFMNGNTFAYTVFCSYGAFWITLGCINVPSFGIISAYEDPVMLGNALGFFLLGWGLFTFMMLTLTVKATLPFMLLFVTLDTGFFVLAGAYMTGSVGAMKAGGIVLVISACCGFYGMIAGVATKYNSYFTLNALPIPQYHKKEK